MGRVKVDIHQGEREFHVVSLSNFDVVKGLLELRHVLDIYNDFLEQKNILSANGSKWYKVNQEIICLYADLDNLISKCSLQEGQVALLESIRCGFTTDDIAHFMGEEKRRLNRALNKICRVITEYHKTEWLTWINFNFFKTEWKQCRMCGESYPVSEKFFHKDDTCKDGYRTECSYCHKIDRRIDSSVQFLTFSHAPDPLSEGTFNKMNNSKKKKLKPKKKRKKNTPRKATLKILLPDGTKTQLDCSLPYEEKKTIVDDIISEYTSYFEHNWDSDKTKKCLDMLGYYLMKEPPTKKQEEFPILSKYKMTEMNEGSKCHTTFSSLSKQQKIMLGLVDIDDSDE